MSSKSYVKEVRFLVTARGRRAYYWGRDRWFPIPVAEAELLVATGQAVDLSIDFAKSETL